AGRFTCTCVPCRSVGPYRATLSSPTRRSSDLALASDQAAVRLLWDVCQVPDFQKSLTDHHLRLLKQIYRHLRSAEERLPEDWVADRKSTRLNSSHVKRSYAVCCLPKTEHASTP